MSQKKEVQSQKSSGLNLNPLVPAQSKRTFAFSGKNQNSIEKASISALFFFYCLNLFQAKVEKEVQGLAPEP